jgi:hypothetical protein
METPISYLEKLIKEGPVAPYIVQLLFEHPPVIDKKRLLESLRKYCGNVEAIDPDSDLLAFAHLDHLSSFQEGDLPAQCLVTRVEEPVEMVDVLGASLLQTWDWPEASEIALRCKTMVLVTDVMARSLRRVIRLKLFHGAIQALLEQLDAAAIHWLASQRVVNPKAYLAGLSTDGPLFPAAVNVRFFNVEGHTDEKVMDTMGLAAFGLSDLQCNFSGLDPASVASLLFKYADYLFTKGEVIQDGHTIEGLDSERWQCRHEDSLAPPKRIVIDIHPGKYSPPR